MIKLVGPLKIGFELDPNVHHEELYLTNFFQNEEEYYTNLLGSYNDPIVFDVGSNVGYFTCLFKSCGSKEVHSFEPIEEPYTQSKKKLSGISGIYLNNFALLHKKLNSKEIFLSKKHNQGSTFSKRIVNKFKKVFDNGTGGYDITTVNTDTIDNYCKEKRISKIDLLKLDTEGTEYNILQGSYLMIKSRSINNIIYESYNQTKEIERLLNHYGYVIHKIDNLTTPMYHAKLKS